MTDGGPPENELKDAALHEEIELVGDLLVAASSKGERLTQPEIDRVLGVDPDHAEPAD